MIKKGQRMTLCFQSLNSAWHIVGAQQIFVKWINEWLKKVKEWTLLQCQWAIQNSNVNQQSTRLQRLYSLMVIIL